MRTLMIVSSYHHCNTLKIARDIAQALEAPIISPDEANLDALGEYDLVGFGSGIYSAAHHPKLLKLADSLPVRDGGKAFLFSTDGVPRFAVKDADWLDRKMIDDHAALRKKLEGKGYEIIGHFNCAGFNTNSFLKFFGGFNKGRPNTDDLARAVAFADGLKHAME